MPKFHALPGNSVKIYLSEIGHKLKTHTCVSWHCLKVSRISYKLKNSLSCQTKSNPFCMKTYSKSVSEHICVKTKHFIPKNSVKSTKIFYFFNVANIVDFLILKKNEISRKKYLTLIMFIAFVLYILADLQYIAFSKNLENIFCSFDFTAFGGN